MSRPQVIVIGLDCVPPFLAFDRMLHVMPTLRELMNRGAWAPLRSTLPPITVPAWTCMVSGRDPGELGIYGFRNRVHGSYELELVTAAHLRYPLVWDWLSNAGKRVAVLFVPPSYPPRPVRGVAVSCFLTPKGARCTWPPSLQATLERRFGPYQADVSDFRNRPRDEVLREIYAMTEQHFSIATHVLRFEDPDFLMMVDIGPDRFHHLFFDCLGRDNTFEHYYGFLDQQLARLLAAAGPGATVLVVSDHGARSMQGGFCINEWLHREAWLVLEKYPDKVMRLADCQIDWSRTRAWGEGGYYGRVFLNVRGREPKGTIDPKDYENVRGKIARALSSISGPNAENVANRVVTPDETYRLVRGLAPDLCVYFGDLAYRSIGTLGHQATYVPQNDTGSDACNHDWDGIFVLSGGNIDPCGEIDRCSIYDVASTIMGCMNVEYPPGLLGIDRAKSSRAR